MEDKANTYSSAALAYLGDCAIELCVRVDIAPAYLHPSSPEEQRKNLL